MVYYSIVKIPKLREANKPRYDLDTLKHLIKDPGNRIMTVRAQKDASQLGLFEEDIVECCLSLTRADFYKSMTTRLDSSLWQDVYKTIYEGNRIYLKLQIDADGQAVIISFKEDTSK